MSAFEAEVRENDNFDTLIVKYGEALTEITKLTKQRDELAAALSAVLAAVPDHSGGRFNLARRMLKHVVEEAK